MTETIIPSSGTTTTTAVNTSLQLKALIKFSLQKRVSPVIFQSLIKQTNHKQEITINDLIEVLSDQNTFDPLLVMYLVSTSLSRESAATTIIKIATILDNLRVATVSNQSLILVMYITQIGKMSSFNESGEKLPLNSFEMANLIKSLANYLKYLLDEENGDDKTGLLSAFADFCLHLLERLPRAEANLTQLISQNCEILSQLINILKKDYKSCPIAEELEISLNKLMKKNSISGSLSTSKTQHNNNNVSSLSFLKSNKSAKIIWLSNLIQTWSMDHTPSEFFQSFEQFVKLKTAQNILNDLIFTSFESYIIALNCDSNNTSSTVVTSSSSSATGASSASPSFSTSDSSMIITNWKLFLMKKLPLLIKHLRLKNLESSISQAFNLIDSKTLQAVKEATITHHHHSNNLGGKPSNHSNNNTGDNFDDMFDSFPSTVIDIRHDILRSLIALDLLPQSAFKNILKQDATADTRPLPPNRDDVIDADGDIVDLKETLKRTLLDVNIEFVSLEESGLLGFLRLMPLMYCSKQVEFAHLIFDTIIQLINDDDLIHLYRLSLALVSTPEALHVLVFHLSPLKLIQPLFKVIDNWSEQHSSNSGDDDDDSNFQETFTSFSCIFLLVLYIIKNFNISLEQLVRLRDSSSSQKSFILRYLTGLGKSVKFDTLTDAQTKTLSDWTTALFETGEGISDDLIRNTSIQQCYDTLPMIFQQVFILYKHNSLDFETLKEGLEYFLQPFLLPTVISILVWCENNLWKFKDVEIISTLLKILLINPSSSSSSDINSESYYIHKAILKIYGLNIWKVLKNIDNSIVSPAVGGGGFDIDQSLLTSLESVLVMSSEGANNSTSVAVSTTSGSVSVSSSNIEEIKVLKFLEFDGLSFIGFSSLSATLITELHHLLESSTTTPNHQYDPKLLKTLLKLQGPDTLLKVMLSEIQRIQLRTSGTAPQQSTSNKGNINLMNLIELCGLLITVTYIESQSEKTEFIKYLKKNIDTSNQEQGKDPITLSKPTLRFLNSWNNLKVQLNQNTESIEWEIFKVFSEKLVEIVDFCIPL